MSISVDNLDLKVISFSRRLSRLFIVEDFQKEGNDPHKPTLYIAVTCDASIMGGRVDLIHFAPTYNGNTVDFKYTATASILIIETEFGKMEVCFDGPDTIRFRSDNGIGAEFYVEFNVHDMFVDRLDGTVEFGYPGRGQFLLEAVTGVQGHNNKWLGPQMRSSNTTVKWDAVNGALEAYITFSTVEVNRPDLRDFDECVIENRVDFNEWCEKYPELEEKYSDTRLYAAYSIWICHMPPLGVLPAYAIYMMRAGFITRAMAWQQSYQAMALWRDQHLCFELLQNMFYLQDEFGMLPDNANEMSIVSLASKPPFQGFALMWIFDHIPFDELDPELCEKLYYPMTRWIGWWMTMRDGDWDGLPAYMHADESGWDDSTIFVDGTPVATPDLAAFLVLAMEACSTLARRIGKLDEAEAHMSESKAMLEKMIKNFWTGEKFICLREVTHKAVDSESIVAYFPIILGKRLPQEIIDKIAADLGDPTKFKTPQGFTSESLSSPYYDDSMGGYALGMRLAPAQFIVILGLYYAGKRELALEQARIWCDLGIDAGPLTVWRKPVPIPMGDDPFHPPIFTGIKPPGGFTSWGSAIFFVLAELLHEAQGEE